MSLLIEANCADINEYKAKIAQIGGISLNHPWGSCQYATAYAMFKVLQDLGDFSSELEADPKGLNVMEIVKQKLGISITYQSVQFDLSTIRKAILEDQEGMKDYYEANERWDQHVAKINAISNLNEAFKIARESSWDLWKAADFFSDLIFPNLEIKVTQASNASGPILNQMIQSGNNLTGIQCWLLMLFGFVTNDTFFGGFDT